MKFGKEKQKYSTKTSRSATLPITNPTRRALGLNPGRRGGNPATNHLSFDTACKEVSMVSFDKLSQYLRGKSE
jgi:hypothetical protein